MRLDDADLAAIAQAVADKLTAQTEADEQLDGKLAYSEATAAHLLDLPKNTLRERRIAGDIQAKLVGKRYLYSRTELVRFLEVK